MCVIRPLLGPLWLDTAPSFLSARPSSTSLSSDTKTLCRWRTVSECHTHTRSCVKVGSCLLSGLSFLRNLNFERIVTSKLNPLRVSGNLSTSPSLSLSLPLSPPLSCPLYVDEFMPISMWPQVCLPTVVEKFSKLARFVNGGNL